MSPKPTKTPAELASLLLSGAMAVTLERDNEGLMSFDAERPGSLELALSALLGNEPSKAAGHLRRAVELCAEPVADGRAQAQRTRLLSGAAGALALLEQPDYRGPDRRAGTDRRSDDDRRHAGASPAGEVLEQRCGEQRRSGGDRRTKAGAALWDALQRSEDAHHVLAYQLAPMLAVCEVASKAVHTLSNFASRASHDKALQERLSGIDPEWQDATDDANTQHHIGQCLLLARDLCSKAAGELMTLTDEAAAALGELKKAGG